ncbi:MAG: hypothetical protein HZB42_14315 [Sphingobacteriales bacterium]|nr:hypothetical protein [Sphingobacteriales bacterium]
MKGKFIWLLFLLVISYQGNSQTITVKKTCECTYDGSISSTIRFSNSKLYEKKAYKAYVKAENTGTCIWGDGEVELRVRISRCPSGSVCQRDELIPSRWTKNDRDIIHGYTEEFVYDFEGPSYLGKYNLVYQLYYMGKPFGDAIQTTIEILDDPNK